MITNILSTTQSFIHKHRQLYILAALCTRAIGAGVQWYIYEVMNIEGLLWQIENVFLTLFPGLQDLATTWGSPAALITPELATTFYDQVRDIIAPYVPVMWLIRLGTTLVSIFIFCLIWYTLLDDPQNKNIDQDKNTTNINKSKDPTPRDRSEKLMTGVIQSIPFAFTAFLQSLLVLTWLSFFLIPGIILIGYFLFTQYVMIDERVYGFSALKRSYQIVKWRRRYTDRIAFAMFALLGILFFILMIFIQSLVASASPMMQAGTISLLASFFSVYIWIAMGVMYMEWKRTAQKNPAL